MIYDYEIRGLIATWQERLHPTTNEPSYKEALAECIFELDDLVRVSHEKELLQREAEEQEIMATLPDEDIMSIIQQWEADSYLSSIEAHENIA